MVSPHLRRVVDLNIETTLLHLYDLHRVLNAGMPTLEVLNIHASQGEALNLAPTLAGLCPIADESLPRLHHLCLDAAFCFVLIAVRSLKVVKLQAFMNMTANEMAPWRRPPSLRCGSFLQALSRCHYLECFYIEDLRFLPGWPPLTHQRPGAVQLPSLKTLSFDLDICHPCVEAFLAALDPGILSTASISLGCENPETLSALMPSNLVQHHPFDTVLISRSCNCTSMGVRCFVGQSLRLDIQFEPYKTFAELGIEDVFRTAAVTYLEIIPEFDPCDAVAGHWAEDWAVVLRAFPHLTYLTVSGPDTFSSVVDALGAVTVAGHGVAAYPASDAPTSGSPLPVCPALRCVTLEWQVPREIIPKTFVAAFDAAAYQQHWDVRPRVEQRCSAVQLAFERRASMRAQKLDTL